MKKELSTVIAALLLAPSYSSAIELTDYSNPESAYDELFLEGKANTKSGNQDQTSYNVNAQIDWTKVNSTKERTLTFDAGVVGDLSQGPNDGDEKVDSSSANINATMDRYLNNDNGLFWFGSGELGYLSDAEEMLMKVGAGVGYGRIINATPLAKVLRITEELQSQGIITGSISRETYLEIAKIVDRENEFASKFGSDEYKPHFFEAIESVLKGSGNLPENGLGARGSLYMDRVLYIERISQRRHGWTARVGLGLILQDYSGASENDPSLDAVLEYAKPYGLTSQFDNVLSYSTIFGDDDAGHLLRNRMSYSYEVTDRIDWENTWNFSLSNSGDDTVSDITNNTLTSSFRYYLSNRMSAGASLSVSMIDDDIDDNGNDDTAVSTFFDIRYRLK